MRNSKNIFASVVIPMYNAEKTIEETLLALNKQNNKSFEVIIIDDGSKDSSLSIVRKYKTNFRLKIISQKNAGPAKARNMGARKASTDIIIFIDSDCVPKINFVEEILKPFRDKEIVGVQGDYETKNKNKIIARYVGYEIAYRHEKMKKVDRIDHIATYACAYRKKDFGKGFSEDFKKANMEDTELSYRIAKNGGKLVFSDRAIVKHPHPSSLGKFLEQQAKRGFWRALGHKDHKDKLVKDSYMGSSMMIQGLLSLAFMCSILFLPLLSLFGILNALMFVVLLFLILYVSNLPLGMYCFRYEKKMLIIAPFIASLRSLYGTIGFLAGLIKFNILKDK
jgi:glycosyltransferase involved in cell wall biosynthesis